MEQSRIHTYKRWMINLKIYLDRARMYLGYINFFMLNLVLINSLDNPALKGFIEEHKWLLVPALFVVFTLLLIFIGYLDTRLGLRQEEMRNNSMNNPVLMDLVNSVNEIKREVRKQKDGPSEIK